MMNRLGMYCRSIFFLGVVVLTTFSQAAPLVTCKVDPQLLHAEYQISRHWGNKLVSEQTMHLWRNGRQVAQQFSEMGITEVWQKQNDERVRPIRYFDREQRAIEYTASEVNHHDKSLWSIKNQLVTEEKRLQMELVKVVRRGCLLEEHYQYEQAHALESLVWLPELQLVKRFEQRDESKRYLLELTNDAAQAESFDVATIHKFFDVRDRYQSTDYADIGDNESDPFLMKMVNLGFVKAGHSGFYSANGDKISGNSHHH